MKPIKRGMTESVTRDGRKVTQLTWFDDVEGAYCLYGVLDDGCVKRWTAGGKYYHDEEESNLDIFAPVEYEWQWLYQDAFGYYQTTDFCKNEDQAKKIDAGSCSDFKRIEESKREVKE